MPIRRNLMTTMFLSSIAFAVSATHAAAPIPVGEFLRQVGENCYQCHGESNGENSSVEGNFDLTELLGKESLDLEDSASWLQVVTETQAGRMPPSEPLAKAQQDAWKLTLESALGHRDLPKRMLTSVEIDNDHSLLYGYDRERYSPFDVLKLQTLSDSRYRTIKSADLMSAEFLGSLQAGLEQVITDYTQSRHQVTKKGMAVGETSPVTINVANEMLRSAVSLVESGKNSSDVDLRIWEPTRLACKGLHPHRGMLPGTYRISFRAKMVGRHLIAEKKKQLEQSRLGRDQNAHQMLMDTWVELYHSKARLALEVGNHEDRKNPFTKTIAEFEIEDEELREFNHEFTLKTATFPYFCFENGPCENRWTQVKFGRE